MEIRDSEVLSIDPIWVVISLGCGDGDWGFMEVRVSEGYLFDPIWIISSLGCLDLGLREELKGGGLVKGIRVVLRGESKDLFLIWRSGTTVSDSAILNGKIWGSTFGYSRF